MICTCIVNHCFLSSTTAVNPGMMKIFKCLTKPLLVSLNVHLFCIAMEPRGELTGTVNFVLLVFTLLWTMFPFILFVVHLTNICANADFLWLSLSNKLYVLNKKSCAENHIV